MWFKLTHSIIFIVVFFSKVASPDKTELEKLSKLKKDLHDDSKIDNLKSNEDNVIVDEKKTQNVNCSKPPVPKKRSPKNVAVQEMKKKGEEIKKKGEEMKKKLEEKKLKNKTKLRGKILNKKNRRGREMFKKQFKKKTQESSNYVHCLKKPFLLSEKLKCCFLRQN